MKIKCTPEKIRRLTTVTADLMITAGIEIRDTWFGYDGDNYDNLESNNYDIKGPKFCDVQITAGDKTKLLTKVYPLPGCKSLGYEWAKFMIPIRLARYTHPLIHEITHFLQHNTLALDGAYQLMGPETEENYGRYISQRAEVEAHFVQLLYINEHEYPKELSYMKAAFEAKVEEARTDPSKRVELIIYAKNTGLI